MAAGWFRDTSAGSGPTIGIAIGAVVGAASDQPAAGIAIGASLGTAAEAGAVSRCGRDDSDDPDT